MKISVLIAAYRAAATIAHALDCVKSQTHLDWELVVVEDGSHDGTDAIVRTFAASVSQPVHYFNLGRNQGVATARNRLMRSATGDVFAFLDADDGWSADHLARGAAHFAAGAGLVVTGVQVFDLSTQQQLGTHLPPVALELDPVATLFKESVIVTSSCVLLSRVTQTTTGAFDPAFRVGEDRDFWLRAALAGVLFKIEPACTCHYAKHTGSTMGRTLLVSGQIVQFYEKYSDLRVIPALRRRRLLASSLENQGRLLRSTDSRASTRLLCRAWRLNPRDLRLIPHTVFSAIRALIHPGAKRFTVVADQLGGQCRHSGIHQLARFLRREQNVSIIETPDTRLRRFAGKIWSLIRRWPVRNQSQAFTELKAGWALATSRVAAMHFLVGENHDPFFSHSSGQRPLIATLHMPSSALKTPLPKNGCIHTLVLLTAREFDFFNGAWGSRQTVVIPHGVDTDFFQPGRVLTPPSILIVGRFLRDFPLTAATVMQLASRHSTWRFDFVIPTEAWHSPDLAGVRALPHARWHDRVDDETLRRLYQEATCHLTPFKDCTANNALVESLACGLPIVTTDRGGVRDYGADSIYPLAANHSAEALAVLCERYAADPVWRTEIAAACREFALEKLSWPVIARSHLALYEQIDRSMNLESRRAA